MVTILHGGETETKEIYTTQNCTTNDVEISDISGDALYDAGNNYLGTFDIGVLGCYWSSTSISAMKPSAYVLSISDSKNPQTDWTYRYGGHSIRPVAKN